MLTYESDGKEELISNIQLIRIGSKHSESSKLNVIVPTNVDGNTTTYIKREKKSFLFTTFCLICPHYSILPSFTCTMKNVKNPIIPFRMINEFWSLLPINFPCRNLAKWILSCCISLQKWKKRTKTKREPVRSTISKASLTKIIGSKKFKALTTAQTIFIQLYNNLSKSTRRQMHTEAASTM